MSFSDTLTCQREFFETGGTKPLDFRKKQLKKLLNVLRKHEDKLYQAIDKDLGKSEFDTYTTELALIYGEIKYFLKNLNKLAKPQKVSTNIVNQMGSSKIHAEPFGNTLIIGAWNYPYLLSIQPVISALAAGNTVILKPSEIAVHTAAIMAELINDNFAEDCFHVFLGGVEETTEILKLKFDKIFFTGSPHVGKIVYQAAAKHLTPVTLELGGKSPAIVTSSANLKVAARRLVWGKFLNAGQTCLAPDYIYAEASIKEDLLEEIKAHLDKYQYTAGAENYTRIINAKNFARLTRMIARDKIAYGGKTDEERLYIEPTVLDNVSWEDTVMQEEIFGPLLPVLTFTDFDEMLTTVRAHEKPLSAYLFSGDSAEKEKYATEISFGGGCINDTVMHVSNPNLPFGGVGNSGMGHYHGKYGFATFSHQKSIMERKTWGEPNLKYPPYTETKKSWIKKLM